MKVLFDARYLSIHGGIKLFVKNFIDGIVESNNRNIEFVLSYSQVNSESYKTLRASGYKVHLIRSKPFQIQEHVELWRLFRKLGSVIVHTPHFNAPLLTTKKVKLITTIQDNALDLFPRELKTQFHKLYYLVAMKKVLCSEKVVAASENTAQTLSMLYNINDVCTIYDCFSGSDRDYLYKDRSNKDFLYVGTNKFRKNLAFLVDVFRTLPSDYRLLVAGDMNDKNYNIYEDVKNKELQDRVIIKGYVSYNELVSLYQHCRALIIPSLLEGFGYPILEAALFKIPVISSNTGSLPEVGNDGCVYFDPTSEDECIRCVREIARNTDMCRELVEKNSKNITRFSSEKCIASYMKLYSEVEKNVD
jgi:glycosyltransferase involved in cell wall biosynthesis